MRCAAGIIRRALLRSPMPAIRLLKNGSEVYPAMLGAIDRASSSIALEMYIFAGDGTGREFRSRLAAAARRGADVKVLVDAVGSWALDETFWDELRQAGGEVRWFRPLRRGLLPFRDHRKLLLVDGRTAFIGGLNIGDEYLHGVDGGPAWRDSALEIEGSDAGALGASFLRMWERAGRPMRFSLFRARRGRQEHGAAGAGREGIRFLESGPEDLRDPVTRAYAGLVRGAVRSVDVAMGYFLPPGKVFRALKRAVRRGVRVRVLLPARSDVVIAQWAARSLYGMLLRAGMEVWEYGAGMLHAKLAVIDDRVVAGSANLDVRSRRINYEIVAVVGDRAVASRARADFADDLLRSTPVKLSDWQRRSLVQRAAERIGFCLLARLDPFLSRLRIARKRW